MLKIAALAPMPKARVSTATPVKPGFCLEATCCRIQAGPDPDYPRVTAYCRSKRLTPESMTQTAHRTL